MAIAQDTTQQLAENPLVEGLERLPVHPTTLVIFGASGDLAKRKLLPAIYNLAHEGALPERFNLIGCARSEWSDDEFRDIANDAIKRFSRRRPDDTVLSSLLSRMRYVAGNFDDAALFSKIAGIAEAEDEDAGLIFNRIFYLAVAPQFFETIAEQLGRAGMNHRDDAETRIVVEKPFGHDLASALALNKALLSVFDERQIYRIDHYLGKETVQNTLVLRFANGIFEPVWNRSFVDNVQITAAEDVALEGRAGYYDRAGALRDLIQNHLLQLLMLTSMEPPVSFSADEIRDEKVKVLHAIRPPAVDEVPQVAVRAQYSSGHAGGKDVPGYLEEEGVADNSVTETFAAVRLEVDNWRWAGVPFYIRTGKALARKVTEIVITLRPVPHLALKQEGSLGVHPNQLVLAMQPNEGVSMSLMAKIPGARMRVRPVNMEFLYGTSFLSQSPEAYERLILDTMRGDPTLFARDDEVEAAWRIVDPILEAWSNDTKPIPQYKAGSSGPGEQDAILLDEHEWRRI
jgi:glucose-6-phosphate 1-dehydrogenase